MKRKTWIPLGTALLLLPAVSIAQAPLGYTISTVAGNGTTGFSGDGGAATDAQFASPSAIAFDSQGNLYIADQLNSRIRKVSGGTVSTIVGTGDKGYFGDTNQATKAGISYPKGIGVDGQGNLYIADTPNEGVRKVNTAGVITTVAGGTYAAYDGDGGPATSAHINEPTGMAVTSDGTFYFSDSLNNRIRKVAADGTISTVAGNGSNGLTGDGGPALSATLDTPQAVALDAAGNLYIADTYNHAIRKVDTDGNISTIAGTGSPGFSGDGGPATKAQLYNPQGVAVGPDGLIYVADTFNARIRVISKNGTISTIAGNGYFGYGGDGGLATDTALLFPRGIAIDPSGNIFFADTQNFRIRELTPVPTPTPPDAAPAISSGGVVSAAAFGGSANIAPGSWIEIYGTNLASSTRQWTAAEFSGTTGPTQLDNTKVTIGGRSAFVSFISPGQVNAQIPSDIGTGPQQLTVSNGTGTSAPFNVTVNPRQPGLFAPGNFNVGGKQYVFATLPIPKTYSLPVAAVPGLASRPAKPGETVVMYGTGFGTTDPNVQAGEVTQGLSQINTPLQILFGQVQATVSYAGLTPGTVGLYQFNVIVPDVPDNDAVALQFTLGGVQSTQTLFIAVKR